MKKIIAIALLVLLSAGPAFATSGTTGVSAAPTQPLKASYSTGGVTDVAIASASKGVYWGWNTTVTGYCLSTFHMSGSKNYGSGFDSTKIFMKDSVAIIQPSSSLSAVSFNGWTAL